MNVKDALEAEATRLEAEAAKLRAELAAIPAEVHSFEADLWARIKAFFVGNPPAA